MSDEKTIIIAEDEADLQEIYSRALESKGFRVLNAQNGDEVFDRLEESGNVASAILLDILMPKMDGFDVLEKIKSKEKFKQMKVIMITNLSSSEDYHKAMESGADAFLVKSEYTPSQLVEKVIQILG